MERQKEDVGMSEIIKKAKITWFWSLRPGKFVDKLTGKNPYPDMVRGQWTGTILEWNATIIEVAKVMAKEVFSKITQEDTLHMPFSIHSKLTTDVFSKWHGKVVCDKSLPYNVVLIESHDGEVAKISVLNINDKGNLI